jgi:glycosyltransferase involved in cell wall biosynthesis
MPKILYLQHANPAAFPPVEYSSKILSEAGFDVRLLGVNSQGIQTLQLPFDSKIASEVLPHTPPGWRQKIAYVRFFLRSMVLAVSWRPDWIYVSDFMAAPVGLVLSRFFGFKVSYHEHDSPCDGPNQSCFIRLLFKARNLLAQTAEFNILPQQDRIRLFKQSTATSRPIFQVWNCPRHCATLDSASNPRQSGEPLSLYFHGSINLDRVPLTLITAAGRSGVPIRIRVVGYETIGSQGTIDLLRKEAETAGGHVTLEFPGPVSRHELARQMRGMHIGWINFINGSEEINLRHLVGASNKAFDYLAGALPLIVSRDGEWRETFEVPGYAKSCDPNDPDEIASVLRWFYENPSTAAAMGRAGQLRISEEWNYERQFAPVFEQIQRALIS